MKVSRDADPSVRRTGHWSMTCRKATSCVQRAVVFAVVAVLAGCSGIPPKVEDVTLYTLAAPPVARTVLPAYDGVLAVTPPSAWPGYDTAQFAYARQPNEIEYYAASRWADTPARMLGPLATRALLESGAFRSVVAASSGLPADLRLDLELVRLRQDFTSQPSRIELVLHVQLVDMRNRRVVAATELSEVEGARSENATGGASAANVALQRMLERIIVFCATSAPPR